MVLRGRMRPHPFRTRGRHTRSTGLSPTLAWSLPALGVALLAVAGQVGWLMRSVLLDVVSLWPGWVLTAGVLVIRHRMLRRRRRALRTGSSITAPLLLFMWVLAGLGLHLTGWAMLPSSAGDLTGPPVGGDHARGVLDVRMDGEVELDGTGGMLYEVNPMRTGGGIAPAQSTEVVIDGEVTVSLREGPDPGWFGSDGWNVSVSSSPEWSVVVRANNLLADLTTLRVRSLQVIGDGRIRLADPSGDVPVYLEGKLILEVPSDASVEVTGPARVGPGWEITATGKRYPGTGDSRFLVRVDAGIGLDSGTMVGSRWRSSTTCGQWNGGDQPGRSE